MEGVRNLGLLLLSGMQSVHTQGSWDNWEKLKQTLHFLLNVLMTQEAFGIKFKHVFVDVSILWCNNSPVFPCHDMSFAHDHNAFGKNTAWVKMRAWLTDEELFAYQTLDMKEYHSA